MGPGCFGSSVLDIPGGPSRRTPTAFKATSALNSALGSAFAHGWEPHLWGGAPSHRLTMGPVQENQSNSPAQPLNPRKACWGKGH
jgi:hypothetical protein